MGERDPRLEHGGLAADRRPGGIGIGRCHDPRLALAIIAHAAGLEDRRAAQRRQCHVEIATAGNGAIGGGATTKAFNKALFGQPVLRNFQAGGAGVDRNPRCKMADCGGVDVFKFEGDDVDSSRKAIERRQVVITGAGDFGRDIAGRQFRLGRQHMDAIAHRRRRQRQHAAQLAPAQDADCRARFDHGFNAAKTSRQGRIR